MRILISHSFKPDREFADKLSTALRSIKAEPWMDNLKAACGDEDTDCLRRELRKRYDYVIPVFSAAYMRDKFLQMELIQALMLEKSPKAPFVLPVVVSKCALYPHLLDRAIDFRPPVDFDEAFSRLSKHLTQSRQVFVVMKFGDKQLDALYDLVIKNVIEAFGFSALRIDEIKDSGIITDRILTEIRRSVCVIAELTGERPNCYFEAGYALALEKELILSAQHGTPIHFDLAGRGRIDWDTPTKLRDELAARLAPLGERFGIRPLSRAAQAST
jgi:hypothetical protein